MSSGTLTRRLAQEVSIMKNNPPENCSAGPKGDDLTQWEATIIGPNDSPYSGGLFKLEINFPTQYPYQAPKIKFITPVYHPNIDNHGGICLDILSSQWSPALNINAVLLSICSLLTDPNPKDPLMSAIAQLYINNRAKYDENVRNHVMQYASEKKVEKKVIASESDDEEEEEEPIVRGSRKSAPKRK